MESSDISYTVFSDISLFIAVMHSFRTTYSAKEHVFPSLSVAAVHIVSGTDWFLKAMSSHSLALC